MEVISPQRPLHRSLATLCDTATPAGAEEAEDEHAPSTKKEEAHLLAMAPQHRDEVRSAKVATLPRPSNRRKKNLCVYAIGLGIFSILKVDVRPRP